MLDDADQLDPSAEPFATYRRRLYELRTTRRSWARLAYSREETAHGARDANELERGRVSHILLLEAESDDVELLRYLLDQEICSREEDAFQGGSDALVILSRLLVELGDPSDTARFWRAKFANFDTCAGAYDIEFAFSMMPAGDVPDLLRAHLGATVDDRLEKYDLEQVAVGLAAWRSHLMRSYPRSVVGLSLAERAAWAHTFGDDESYVRYAIGASDSPGERARVYREVGQHEKAVVCWREEAARVETDWDRVAALRNLVEDAAPALQLEAGLEAARTIESLRSRIDSWAVVGLGRMATESCYRLAAAAAKTPRGRALYALARGWHVGLDSFTQVGLEAAVEAARACTSGEDVEEIELELAAERERIERELRGL